MEINKITSNTKFKGIYRLPNTPRNALALREFVVPAYKDVKGQKLFAFPGNNPFKIGIDIIISMVAENNNSSRDWVKSNAENHGLNFSNLGDNVIHIITSDKDVERLKKFLKTRTSKQHNMLRRINKYFKAKNPNKEYYSEIPEHLKTLFAMLRRNKEEDKAFAQFAQNAIEVDSPEELLSFLLTEK